MAIVESPAGVAPVTGARSPVGPAATTPIPIRSAVHVGGITSWNRSRTLSSGRQRSVANAPSAVERSGERRAVNVASAGLRPSEPHPPHRGLRSDHPREPAGPDIW